MKIVKDIVISIYEPTETNVGWLKPMPDKTFMLFFFGSKGWTPISGISGESSGEIKLQYIEDVPDIVINI